MHWPQPHMQFTDREHKSTNTIQDPIFWITVLVNVLLFAVFSIVLILAVPDSDNHKSAGSGKITEFIIHGVAAILAIIIAPNLLRKFDQMHHRMSRQTSALDSLHRIDLAISSQTSLDAIIQVAVREATIAVDGELGLVRLFGNASDTPTHQAWFNVSQAAQSIIASEEERLGQSFLALTPEVTRDESLDEQWRTNRLLDTIKLRNRIVVPIHRQDAVYGVILVGNRSDTLSSLGGFSESDAGVLQDICATIAIAIQNTKLFQETERRGTVLRSLVARTGDAIAASSDAPRLMQILADEAARILGSKTVAVYAFDEQKRQFNPIALHQQTQELKTNSPTFKERKEIADRAEFLKRERFYSEALPLDYLAKSRNTLFDTRSTVSSDPYVHNICNTVGLAPDAVTILDAPGFVFVLRSRENLPIGMLCMADTAHSNATNDSVAFAHALASQAAVALENALLSQQTTELLARTQALQAASHQIAAELDAERALQAVTNGARRILGADGYSLWSWQESDNLWRRIGGFVESDTDAPIELTAEGSDLLDTVRTERMPQFMTFRDTLTDISDRSWLALPLIHAGAVTGVMTLHYVAERTFSFDEINLAQSLANQAGNALYNAQLFSELSAAFARERRIAETLQTSLLSDIPNRVGTLQFAEKYQAGHEEAAIGGDLYDLFWLNDRTLGIVMADVTGKGLTAAVQTAMVKYTLRGFALDLPNDPAKVLSMTNHVLCSKMGRLEGFVTLFYMIIDTESGKFSYSLAGHETPIIRTHSGETMSLDGHSGAPLGCFGDTDYEAREHHLEFGDTLLLYTDGLTEARAEGGPFLGTEGLIDIVGMAGFEPDENIDFIYNAVRRFSNDALRDDVAMLIVKRTAED